jgi:hypothetical protein
MEAPVTAGVADTPENQGGCKCSACHSNPPGGAGLYCARGLSEQRIATVGCICTSCPVYEADRLTDGYFCAVPADWWERFRRHEPLRPSEPGDS